MKSPVMSIVSKAVLLQVKLAVPPLLKRSALLLFAVPPLLMVSSFFPQVGAEVKGAPVEVGGSQHGLQDSAGLAPGLNFQLIHKIADLVGIHAGEDHHGLNLDVCGRHETLSGRHSQRRCL